MPPARPRVIDHLNTAAHFVQLWPPADNAVINKTHIVAVTELTEAS